MFKRRWPWIIAIILIVFVGCYFYFWLYRIYDIPTDPEQMTLYSLYSIDGGDYETGNAPKTTEKIDGHPILGKVEIVDHSLRKEIMAALQQGRAEHSKGRTPMCFYPRHALRIVASGRFIDYIICYQCQSILIIEANRRGGTATTDASLAILNKTLTDAGVTLAPYYFDEKKRK